MFTILLTLCLASSAFAAEPVNVITRGLVDIAITLVESMLGFSLASLWTTIADIGGAIYAQFILIMTNLVFAGQQVIAQVAPIFAQLANDIVNHVAEASIYIEAAFQQIATIMNINLLGKRDVASFRGLVNWAFEILLASVETALGFSLAALWTAVQAAGQAMVNQFIMIVTALATATTAVIAQVTPIFSQLMLDLVNHASEASIYIEAAFQQIATIMNLNLSGKRSLGKGLVNWAFEILLASVETALGFSLAALWTAVQAAGQAMVNQFIMIVTALATATTAVIAQVTPIFSQLMLDLVNHASEASIYIEAAFQQIATIMNLNLSGKRDLAKGLVNWAFEILLASVETALGFSLAALWTAVQAAGQAMVNQFIMIVTALATATTAVIAQVTPIFSQLMLDLVNHASEASIYIEAAFQQIATIMNLNLSGKRALSKGFTEILFTIALAAVEQALGFSLAALWTAVQAAGQALVNQFIFIITQLATATTAVIAQVTPIFSQLMLDLVNHASEASIYIEAAFQQITTILTLSGKY
jgi:DNA-binding transcriptional regulator YdaS (Cro superfamily)